MCMAYRWLLSAVLVHLAPRTFETQGDHSPSSICRTCNHADHLLKMPAATDAAIAVPTSASSWREYRGPCRRCSVLGFPERCIIPADRRTISAFVAASAASPFRAQIAPPQPGPWSGGSVGGAANVRRHTRIVQHTEPMPGILRMGPKRRFIGTAAPHSSNVSYESTGVRVSERVHIGTVSSDDERDTGSARGESPSGSDGRCTTSGGRVAACPPSPFSSIAQSRTDSDSPPSPLHMLALRTRQHDVSADTRAHSVGGGPSALRFDGGAAASGPSKGGIPRYVSPHASHPSPEAWLKSFVAAARTSSFAVTYTMPTAPLTAAQVRCGVICLDVAVFVVALSHPC